MSNSSGQVAPPQPAPPFTPQKQDPPGLDRKMDPPPKHLGEAYRPAGKLEGKVTLITGGDSGIGRAVAVLYAKEGADVAIVHLPAEQPDADDAKREIEAFGRRCVTIAGDVADPGFCESAVGRTVKELGGLNVLVNNAAVMQLSEDIAELSVEQFRRTFEVNIVGYFQMAKAAVPHLSAGDCIIQTGSIAGMGPFASGLDYAATKAAIHSFTQSLGKQLLKSRGVRVNCVAPGPVWTPLNASARPADGMASYGDDNPMGRPAQPEELAPAYVYLASAADSGFVNGAILQVSGGQGG